MATLPQPTRRSSILLGELDRAPARRMPARSVLVYLAGNVRLARYMSNAVRLNRIGDVLPAPSFW